MSCGKISTGNPNYTHKSDKLNMYEIICRLGTITECADKIMQIQQNSQIMSEERIKITLESFQNDVE